MKQVLCTRLKFDSNLKYVERHMQEQLNIYFQMTFQNGGELGMQWPFYFQLRDMCIYLTCLWIHMLLPYNVFTQWDIVLDMNVNHSPTVTI